MKRLDFIRLFGVVALFCVALALGGIVYELHLMRSSWSPVVYVRTPMFPGTSPKFEVEIKRPIEIQR